jgi:hypothetical protein
MRSLVGSANNFKHFMVDNIILPLIISTHRDLTMRKLQI